MSAPRIWTREEVLALPDDGRRYELVDGELLVSPSPSWPHQFAVGELFLLVHPYVTTHRVGEALFAPADLDLHAGQLVQPDLFVYGMPGGRRITDWVEIGVPILIAEVLSPSTAGYDRVKKRRLYRRVGVPVYWIIDLDARRVEIWTPEATGPDIVEDQLIWQPDRELPALVIDLPEYFRRVWREEEGQGIGWAGGR